MNMTRCDSCGDLVDTDAHPEVYVQPPWLPIDRLGYARTVCWCWVCQERELAEHGMEEFST